MITMARANGREVKVWGKHFGEWHEMIITLDDLLPKPESEEYSALVAELLRRIPAIA